MTISSFLHSPLELRPISNPVDDVEDEEENGHGDQEEPVSVDIVGSTTFLHWLLQI